jgi:hypothetical protein
MRLGFLDNRPALLVKSLNMAAAEARTPPEGREAAQAGFLDLDLRGSQVGWSTIILAASSCERSVGFLGLILIRGVPSRAF